MLKVIVEIWPGGRESGRNAFAAADIGRIKNGTLADYRVELHENGQGGIGSAGLLDYPRYSTTVWDLVARAIAVALTGKEELPPRSRKLDVPVRVAGNVPYIRLREIPEPARSMFQKHIAYSTRPLIEEDPMPMDCVYSWDWFDFLAGDR
ncbi:hypothetical protein [Paraburkholderia sp. BCC1885]|uniref:hypothetical protein n=1 Tax=Paraburkholderia sp. BCC1885 TaxID=2562669 RepID=UPI00118208BA|nr:hypothetical protein [Paraburkholderia sp. BCC1885]